MRLTLHFDRKYSKNNKCGIIVLLIRTNMTGNIKYDFTGNVVAIFGGAGSISHEIATAFGRSNARILLFDLFEEALKKEADELTSEGISVSTYVSDVTQYQSVRDSVENAMKDAGKIDVLINAASVVTRKPFFEISDRDWSRTINVNLTGTFLTCNLVGKLMADHGYGRIINFSSQNSMGAKNNADYAASKAGIDSITRSLAVELREEGKDVTVNAIIPPPTVSAIWKKGRTEEQISNAIRNKLVFESSELIDLVMFLSSREAFSISGQVISHKANLFRVPNR